MRMYTYLLVILVAAVRPGVVAAQDALTSRVDQIFAAYDRKDSPGCAVAVYREGRIAYARGYGMAELEAGVPITPGTVFDIGSTSKQFTAASIVLLAQQGKLSLDDDVRRYIPELPQYQQPITLRQLLHHTSGVRDYIGLLTLGGFSTAGRTTPQQALDAIVRQKALNFEPGAEFLYSNSGYFLLSVVVERVSGKSLRAFAAENIFVPLGMRATQIHEGHSKAVPNRATGYAPAASAFRVALSNWEQTGDGAVYTTVEDLLLWDRNFYEPKVGGQSMLTELHTRGTLNNGTTLPYALGLMSDNFRGLNVVSHGGSWAGYRAELIRFPEEKLSVATLCNLGSSAPSALARAVAAVYLEDKLAPLPVTAAQPTADTTARIVVAPAELLQWVAVYTNPATGTVRYVTLENGTLMATFGTLKQEIVPRSTREFTTAVTSMNLTLSFERDSAGARRIRQFADGRETALFVEVVPPSEQQLQSYTGSYYSEELNTTYTLVAANGALVLQRADGAATRLRALPHHTFQSGSDLSLRFTPDADGRNAFFELSIGRVRGIRFVRNDG